MSCRHFAVLLILAVATVHPLAVYASHDVPRKSAGIRVGLVRAYEDCTEPNAVHDQVVVLNSACAPAVAFSPYRFGPQGQATAQVQTVSGGIKMRFALPDVRTVGDTPVSNMTFRGRVSLRVTDHGCSSAPSCTIETFIGIDIPCVRGRCVASHMYPDLFLPTGLEGSAEVLGVDVLDAAGNRFATHGLLLN